jgi:hypothetical protein
MAVPAVGLGLATRYTTAIAAMTYFTGAQIVLLAAVGVLGRRHVARYSYSMHCLTAAPPFEHSGYTVSLDQRGASAGLA